MGPIPCSPPLASGLGARPNRPTRRIWKADKVLNAVAKALRQRDMVISDRDTKIAWLDSKLEALGVEHREDAAALESVLAGMEAENVSLKVEVARLKEKNECVKGRLDQLTEQMATLENDLSLRIRPHKVTDMMLSRLWEWINISQRIVQLVDPDFPVDLINLSNRSTQRHDSLVGEPRDR